LFLTSKSREQNILLVYLIYERLKGEQSFYHAYFDAVNQFDATYFWDEKVFDTLLNTEFKTAFSLERDQLKEEFETFIKVFQLYPQFFPYVEKITY
jgi:hypothetical protein